MSEYFEGRSLSSGIGIGSASILPEMILDHPAAHIDASEVEEELKRFRRALDDAMETTSGLKIRAQDTLYEQLSDLFSVQEQILEDPVFIDEVYERIEEEHLRAESAILGALESIRETFLARSAEDPLKTRVADILDVGWRVLRHMDATFMYTGFPQAGVLIARQIVPSMAVRLAESDVDALVVKDVDRSSHTAVVAQALQIPTMGVVNEDFYEKTRPGNTIIVAANQDRVFLNPDEELLETYRQARKKYFQFTRTLRQKTEEIPESDLAIPVRANLGLLSEISLLKRYGGFGSGLVRTELLFMSQSGSFPNREEQLETYLRVARAVDPHPVTLRTFDFGGDVEPLTEGSSAIGLNRLRGRGVYRSLLQEDRFRTQLKAMGEAYHEQNNIRILLPMVGSPKEVQQTRDLLRSVSPAEEDLPPLGVMVEVPSLLFLIPELSDIVDFLSIGTNDLTYYLLGADRFEGYSVDSVDLPEPVLLRCIHHVVEETRDQTLPVGICGEIAGNPVFTPVFVGFGLSELSMSPLKIPAVKLVASQCDRERAGELAFEVASLSDRTQMIDFVQSELGPYVQDILREYEVPKEGRRFDYFEQTQPADW